MKIKYILQILVLGCFLHSCNITELDPLDSISDPTYWRNLKDLELYANGFYTRLTAPGTDKDNQSDDFVSGSYNSFLFNEYTIPTSGGGYAYADWEYIRNCNYFLQRYHTVNAAEANINRYVAEIRFFRAWEYFSKVKRFGDVPWLDSDLNVDDTDLFKKRDSRDFVVGKIVEDLEYASKWLPSQGGSRHTGRLTKEAAQTFLARVCLHEGTFRKYHSIAGTGDITPDKLIRKAADYADSVMSTGYYSIVKGTDAGAGQSPFPSYPLYYSNQFTQEDLAQNDECILPRIYIEGVVTHQASRTAGEPKTGLSKDFIESYLDKDGLPISLSSVYSDESVDDEVKNRDPRLYQTVDNWNKPYTIINGQRQTNTYPDIIPDGGVTGYQCVKFRSCITTQNEANKSTYDWFIFRYAEVLLIYAEAKTELNECTQTVLNNTINLLRDRVGMPPLTTAPVTDPAAVNYGYTITPLLYEIRRERRVELVAEGFRFDDIVRWRAGKLFENPKTFLGLRVTQKVIDLFPAGTFGGENGRAIITYQGKDYLKPYAGKALNDEGRIWKTDDKRYLYPIPIDQITINSNIEQNHNWN